MKNKSLIRRYARGLLGALQSDDEYTLIYRELCEFAGFLVKQKKLNNMLVRPFLPTSKKKKIVEEILSQACLQAKTSRFILLLIENERLEILPDLIEFLPDFWNAEKGIATYEVSSVVPLSDEQKLKLETQLESFTQKPVILKYNLEPELIGGLLVRKGNTIYDASVKGHLEKLQEQIIEEG
jgi:F-type H+-transporting ATPase subunit delta